MTPQKLANCGCPHDRSNHLTALGRRLQSEFNQLIETSRTLRLDSAQLREDARLLRANGHMLVQTPSLSVLRNQEAIDEVRVEVVTSVGFAE